jgi:deoxyribodipyrimidine photo-lyase
MKTKVVESWGLHWFRRDLRLQGNLALNWNVEKHDGRVLGVFFFDSDFLQRRDFSHPRFAFFMDTLESLREDMRARGGDLLVLDARPQNGFPSLLKKIANSVAQKPAVVTFNRDYEPFARERDSAITRMLEEDCAVPVHSERDHLLIEPHELTKPDGGFYQVYTPFSRRWFELLRRSDIGSRIEESGRLPKEFSLTWAVVLGRSADGLDQLTEFKTQNAKKVSIPIPKAGALAAKKCLAAFKEKITSYREHRDYPAVRGTSQLSIFLKNGSITVAQAISALALERESVASESGSARYLKELVWREFYYHILWHRPQVENDAFIGKYSGIEWENNSEYFEAWKSGRTGYPIVDAGMRQLNATGWMHNRVRMIVASFLTKDLLIDWRWGERYFMEKLLDGDLAPNNGGWQWAASTGCDPQPYFRIFNPTLQSEKFDPDGTYIKRWCPELKNLSGKALHEPKAPIVDHASRKMKALKLYQSCA